MKKTIILLATLLSAVAFSASAQESQKQYGYQVSDFMSTPKVGGYIIGSYKYTDQEGAHGGPGFNCRLIRLYVDGSIFNDFKYRIQFQANGTSPHVKDFFIEWAKYKEFSVKVGQFKRAFTFENPMNPWDVGVGDFSFLVQKMAGMGDRLGEANMGGRDQGIQVQGDLFPMANDQYRLLHYQLGLYNGQGINLADANRAKDIIGTIQIQRTLPGLPSSVSVSAPALNTMSITGRFVPSMQPPSAVKRNRPVRPMRCISLRAYPLRTGLRFMPSGMSSVPMELRRAVMTCIQPA